MLSVIKAFKKDFKTEVRAVTLDKINDFIAEHPKLKLPNQFAPEINCKEYESNIHFQKIKEEEQVLIGTLSIQFDQMDITKLGENQFSKDVYEYVKSDLKLEDSAKLEKQKYFIKGFIEKCSNLTELNDSNAYQLKMKNNCIVVQNKKEDEDDQSNDIIICSANK